MVRIKCEGLKPWGARITTGDGTPIEGVRSLDIRMHVNDIVTAQIEVNVSAVDVMAHPLLGLDTLEAAAAAHGFKLIPKG